MKRKKIINLIMKMNFLVVLSLLLFANSALSRPLDGYDATVTEGMWGNTAGGEFDIIVSDPNGSYSVDFIGFCLEINEDIFVPYEPNQVPKTYQIKSVVDYSEKGGTDGQTNATGDQDPLSAASKWVYWNYITGFFGNRSDPLADEVQRTIWALEEENNTSAPGYIFDRLSFISSSSLWQTHIHGKNIETDTYFNITGDVFVLNLMEGDDFIQSVIVGEPVPEPATMLLFGTGLIGLAGFARSRRSKK